MADNAEIVKNWIQALNQAYYDLKPLTSLSDTFGNLSTEDAYQVQFRMLEDRIKQGERLIGWKIGATSSAVQGSFSFPLSEPVFGWMTDKSDYSGLDKISTSSFCNLHMEAEIDSRFRVCFGTPSFDRLPQVTSIPSRSPRVCGGKVGDKINHSCCSSESCSFMSRIMVIGRNCIEHRQVKVGVWIDPSRHD